MKTVRSLTLTFALPALALALSMTACEKKAETPTKPAAGSTGAAKSDGHDHKDGDGHDHKAGEKHDHKDGDDHDHKDGHGHGPKTELGSQSAGGMTIVAAREGGVEAGKEATFDISVTGGTGKPAAVRAWVGTQDGKGSVKGKAEAEGDGWHAHAEVPSPLGGGRGGHDVDGCSGRRWGQFARGWEWTESPALYRLFKMLRPDSPPH